MYIQKRGVADKYEGHAVKMTSIRLDTKLANDAVKVLHVKSRSEAVHVALGR